MHDSSPLCLVVELVSALLEYINASYGDKFGLIVENNGDGENSNYSFFMEIRERGGKAGMQASTQCTLNYRIENRTVS